MVMISWFGSFGSFWVWFWVVPRFRKYDTVGHDLKSSDIFDILYHSSLKL